MDGVTFFLQFPTTSAAFFGALQAEDTSRCPFFQREHATLDKSLHVSYDMVELAPEK